MSYIRDQVAALAPGAYADIMTGTNNYLITGGFHVLEGPFAQGGQSLLQFGSKGWRDSVTGRIFFAGAMHQPPAGKAIIIYDEATNAWWEAYGDYGAGGTASDFTRTYTQVIPMSTLTDLQRLGDAGQIWSPSHGYEDSTGSSFHREFYHSDWNSPDTAPGGPFPDEGHINVYHIDNGTWRQLPSAGFGQNNLNSLYMPIEFFPEMGAQGTIVLLSFTGLVLGYDRANQQWRPDTIAVMPSSMVGKYSSWMNHDPKNHCLYVGGGNQGTDWQRKCLRINANATCPTSTFAGNIGTVVLDDCPVNSGNSDANNSIQAVDESTGIMYMHAAFRHDGSSEHHFSGHTTWALNSNAGPGSQWTQITGSGADIVYQTGAGGGMFQVLAIKGNALGATAYIKDRGPSLAPQLILRRDSESVGPLPPQTLRLVMR